LYEREGGRRRKRRENWERQHNARGIPRHFRITPAKSPRVFAFPRGEHRQKLIAYLRGQQMSLCADKFCRLYRKSKTLGRYPGSLVAKFSFQPIRLNGRGEREETTWAHDCNEEMN